MLRSIWGDPKFRVNRWTSPEVYVGDKQLTWKLCHRERTSVEECASVLNDVSTELKNTVLEYLLYDSTCLEKDP